MRSLLAVALISALGALAGAASPAAAIEPDPVVSRWPTWPYPVTCGSLPFDPISVFGGTLNAALGTQPAEVALREFLASHNVPWHPPGYWRLAAANEEIAELVSGRLSTGLDWMRLENQDSVWKWTGSGGCKPRSLRNGIVSSEWRLLDESAGLKPKTRALTIGVQELACTGGADPSARIQVPDLLFSKHRLIIATWITPLPPGIHTCPGNPVAPYKLKLPRPLSNRVLVDGSTYPPKRRATTLRPAARAPGMRPSARARVSNG
jgi:hypothetical protein